jgi:hypothetical protein
LSDGAAIEAVTASATIADQHDIAAVPPQPSNPWHN